MRIATLAALLLLVPASIGSPRLARAELLGPGTYSGWVVQDRWGAVHLANGVYLLEFRGQAKKAALVWKDKPVRVEVTKILEGDGPDDQAIGAVGEIAPAKPAHGGRLRVELQQPEICPPDVDRQHMDVLVRYEGEEKLRLDLGRLMVIARRIGGPLPQDAKGTHPLFVGHDDQGTAWRAGGGGMDVLEQGKRVRHSQVFKAVGGRLEVAGALSYRTELVLDLPPGEYEVFAVLGDENFSKAPAPRSRMLDFDVVSKPR